MAKQDDFVRYTIRVPAALYARLQESAGVKSVNAEIVARLEASFAPRPAPSDDTEKQLTDVAQRLRRMEMTFKWLRLVAKSQKHLMDNLSDAEKKALIDQGLLFADPATPGATVTPISETARQSKRSPR